MTSTTGIPPRPDEPGEGLSVMVMGLSVMFLQVFVFRFVIMQQKKGTVCSRS